MELITGTTLRAVKYNDNSSILTIWSKELGRLSVVVSSGSTKEARRRKAILMPLGVFEAVLHKKSGQEVSRISDVRQIAVSPAASGNPIKTAVTLFLAEFLYSVLKESSPDSKLGDFLLEAITVLNGIEGGALANFHLVFLYKLGHFLGIEPDIGSYSQGSYFDLSEARLSATASLHKNFLSQDDSRAVRLLSRLNWRNMSIPQLSRYQRNEILDHIIKYYTLHHAPIYTLPSLDLLREMFS